MSLFFDKKGKLLIDSMLPLAVTFLVLGLLIVIAVKLRSWYRDDSGPAADRDELLLHFKNLQRRGQITGDEYRSIRGRLVDQNADSSTAGSDANEEQGCHAANDSDSQQVVTDSGAGAAGSNS